MALKMAKPAEQPQVIPALHPEIEEKESIPVKPSHSHVMHYLHRQIAAMNDCLKVEDQINLLVHDQGKANIKPVWDKLHKDLDNAVDTELESVEELLAVLLRYYASKDILQVALEEALRMVSNGH
jgi:hypothetical protein